MRLAITLFALALLALVLCGCECGPEKRHAQTEWELRTYMPTFTPRQWNAWERELAAALDKPAPEPPMFPDADKDDPDAGDTKEGDPQ